LHVDAPPGAVAGGAILLEDAMTLQEQLDRLREASKARIPAEARAIMERSVEDLRR